jgi:glucosyl-3-phosphoglycerate synthase
MSKNWLARNTFHYSEFQDIQRLVRIKEQRGLTISLCLPTLNEEKTIGKEILIMRSELMQRAHLIDEIVVVDSGSSDRTLEIARSYGAKTHEAINIFPDLDSYMGKGENLWKALYITKGDIIVYLDADIKNIHHRFAYGLIGPLLMNRQIKFTKAFYDRPIRSGNTPMRPTGGGRVTELVIRPLFSLFFPELTQIIQPLSGEYAGFRDLFQQISFPIGYGVETSMILDIYDKWGLDVMAQVDLKKRVHRNQSTRALGRMAFVILKTFWNRLEQLDMVDIKRDLYDEMIQYKMIKDSYQPDIYKIQGQERPPIIEIPAYRERFDCTGLGKKVKIE